MTNVYKKNRAKEGDGKMYVSGRMNVEVLC